MTEPPTRNYHRKIAEERDRLRTQLQAVIAAWDSLPGGLGYSPKRVERWLVDDMAPVIGAARAVLEHGTDHVSDTVTVPRWALEYVLQFTGRDTVDTYRWISARHALERALDATTKRSM